ncbi:MAG: hypothetical protein ACI9J3_001797 [Parvicellaceae bacterium]|jgi:hypothetical protein
MNLLILKTDIATEQRLQAIKPVFDIHVSIKDWSVDINDVDNVLRVVAKDSLNQSDVIQMVENCGFKCEELDD